MRQSYDTSLKHLVRLGLHTAIPSLLLLSIPSSNMHRWRNESPEKYTGCHLNHIAQQKLEMLRDFAAHQNAQRMFVAYMRLVVTFKQIIGKSCEIKKLLFSSRSMVADVIQKTRSTLGLKKASKFFGISSATLYNWLLECKVKCSASYFSFCVRQRSNQLTKAEVEKTQDLLNGDQFRFWPVSSIAHYAIRNNLVNACVNTFYKYSRLLGIKRTKFIKLRHTGIRASCIHQYWHADITIFKLNDIKFYLYLLVDNYSRCILNWKCEKTVSGIIVKQLLTEAIEKYTPEKVQLLVDGGCENNNGQVDLFIYQNEVIQRLVAQRDISFSNSMVEAVNKIIKNNYLHLMHITSEKQLIEKIAFAITDYNTLRPHNSLGGHTPYEILSGNLIDKSKLSLQISKAKTERMAYNLNSACKSCQLKGN